MRRKQQPQIGVACLESVHKQPMHGRMCGRKIGQKVGQQPLIAEGSELRPRRVHAFLNETISTIVGFRLRTVAPTVSPLEATHQNVVDTGRDIFNQGMVVAFRILDKLPRDRSIQAGAQAVNESKATNARHPSGLWSFVLINTGQKRCEVVIVVIKDEHLFAIRWVSIQSKIASGHAHALFTDEVHHVLVETQSHLLLGRPLVLRRYHRHHRYQRPFNFATKKKLAELIHALFDFPFAARLDHSQL